MKFFNAPTEFKAFGDSGSFDGYAAIFGNVDSGGDILERGAFKEIVKGRDGKVKILSQHRTMDPIGTADVKADEKGLHFQGQLILEAPSGRRDYALMKGGALDGMSFGYDVLPGGAKVLESGVRQLTGIKLWEISPVVFGMNALAGIDAVKQAGQITTTREFEDFLRDAGGFSKAQATAIASGGFKAMQGLRDAGDAEAAAKQLLDFMQSLKA